MKRILSFFLCLSMVFSMLPVPAFAQEPPVSDQTLSTEAAEPAASAPPETEPTEATAEVTETAAEDLTLPAALPEETSIPMEPVLAAEEASLEETGEVYVFSELICATDPEAPGSEELFAGYVQQQFYGGGFSTFGIAAGSLLEGDEKVVYDAVVPQLRKIAAGKQSRGVISIGKSVADHPADVEIADAFTGSEFTVDQLYSVMWALLADLPFELYWVDKTAGIKAGAITSGGKVIQVILYFTVADSYQSTEPETDEYDLNTEKTGAAANAAANAKMIVLDYSNASDYEKLLNYKNTICSLVTYNSAATKPSTPYGDPWQLIYVFDGDPDTNVVCEGYSKAFQYLCDLSSFSVEVLCHSVTGFINNDKVNGNHMWNIVSVDGKNYLADITNSDSGMAGANGSLFLAGGSGSIKNGYTFAGVWFQYNETATATWGIGTDSILTLDSKRLTADNFPMTPTDTLEKLLNGTEPPVLTTALRLNESVTIPRDLTIASGGSLIVPQGITLTIPKGVTVTNQNILSVLSSGTLVLNGTIIGNPPQTSSGSSLTGTGAFMTNSVSDSEELSQILNGPLPYHTILVPVTGDMILDRSLTIPENVTLQITNARLTVAESVTLQNLGRISLAAGGVLTVQWGAALTGSKPVLAAPDAVFEDLSILTQERLTAMLKEDSDVTIYQSLTLTDDLTIPAEASLTIAGGGIFLTIPAEKTLLNLGQIHCLSGSGIRSSGGTLYNEGQLHARESSTVDLTDGVYTSAGTGLLYNHYAATDAGVLGASLSNIPSGSITAMAEGFSEAQLQDLLARLEADSPASLIFLTSQDLILREELTWPVYGTMTIPEGVTLTVAETAVLHNEGQILLSGKLRPAGTVDAALRPIRITRPLPEGLTDSQTEAYVRKTHLLTDDILPAFVFAGMAPTQLNCSVSQGDGTEENPVLAAISTSVPIRMLAASPLGADLLSHHYQFQLLEGNAQLLVGENAEPYDDDTYFGSQVRVHSDTAGLVRLRITPKNTLGKVYGPEYARDILISFMVQRLDVTADGEMFLLHDGGYGLWAGSTMTLMPKICVGTDKEISGTIFCSIDGGEFQEFTEPLSFTASAAMSEKTTTVVTFRTSDADDLEIPIVMYPAAASADLICGEETVTGQTIPIDLKESPNTLTLLPVVAPSDSFLEGYDLISWESSDPGIATVEDGIVTFTNALFGDVTITMTASFGTVQRASVTYQVSNRSRAILPYEKNPAALIGGSAGSFQAVRRDTGDLLKASTVKWSLCNSSGEPIASHPYASISASGRLTTKAVADPHVVYLTARPTDPSLLPMTDPVPVQLYPAITSAAILDPQGAPLSGTLPYDPNVSGSSFILGWQAAPCAESISSVAWASSNSRIAEVAADGTVTIHKNGLVTLRLTVTALNGRKATASIKLKIATYTQSLTVTAPESLTVHSGETLSFTAVSNPTAVTTPGHVWVLSHRNAGSISSSGLFKAKNVLNPTEVVLTAASRDGNCTSEPITITVLPKKGSLILFQTDDQGNVTQGITGTTQSVTIGDRLLLTASEDVTWTSSRPYVANFDDTGALVAADNGTTVITAKAANGRKAVFSLKVSKISKSVTVSVKNNAAPILASGKSLHLVGTVTYNDARPTRDTKVVWSMEKSPLATLSSSGKLTAARNLNVGGTVYITATAWDGRSVTETPFVVDILPATRALEIYGPFSPGGNAVDVTNTTQKVDLTECSEFTLSVRVFPTGAREDVTWKSSNTRLADFARNADGSLATAEDGTVSLLFRKPGTVTITATANDGTGKRASFKLTAVKTVEALTLPETAFTGGGKAVTMTRLPGWFITPDATNRKVTWSMTQIVDGSECSVPRTIATLSSSGVLQTRAVSAPVTLCVRAKTLDGSNITAACTVTVYPITRGVTLYDDAGMNLSRRTVTMDAQEVSFLIRPDTTNRTGFGPEDDGTADEYLPALEAWTITASRSGLQWRSDCIGRITLSAVDPDALVGKTVKLTFKANDGSGKSNYIYFRFT